MDTYNGWANRETWARDLAGATEGSTAPMGIIEDALARQARQPAPRRIDYDRMNRVLPGQRAALTRAINSGDPEKVAKACKAAVTEWNEIGAWPDQWSRWQRALDDALGFPHHIDLADL